MVISKNIFQKIPKKPGVYFFKKISGDILYIGKAKNLKNRIKQYLSKTDNRPQIPFLMKEAEELEYTIVNTELESLYLERTLIQKYKPKYNLDLRDDKNYAFIKIDYSTEIPQIIVIRKFDGIINGSQYFGPFTTAKKIHKTLNIIRKIFSYCSSNKISHKPCFYYHLHRCPGVCIGKISLVAYKQHLEKIVTFLKGDTETVSKLIQKEMSIAAKQKKFETAANLRDQLLALKMLREKQSVILPKKVDWDIISFAINNNILCFNLFKIRSGKMMDKENFVYETTEKYESTDAYRTEVLQKFLEQYYLETSLIPKIIYTQMPPNNSKLISDIIKSRFKKSTSIIFPQKGQAKKLISLGKLNAEEYLKNWLNDKAGNLDKINKALKQLKEVLKLPTIPKRIECYDISNTQGTNAVGSMVVFKNGMPAKSEYRKFKIRIIPPAGGPDDFAMLKEMLSRRLSKIINPELKIKNNWPKPDLIIIDGGRGQLNTVLPLTHNSEFLIPTISLAKRQEEIYLPNKKNPITLPPSNPGLQLLQRIRDEAHRFGIGFHRTLRSKQAVKSKLDEIAGVGPKTKKLLKNKFGTVANIKKVSMDELAKIVGFKIAMKIKESL